MFEFILYALCLLILYSPNLHLYNEYDKIYYIVDQNYDDATSFVTTTDTAAAIDIPLAKESLFKTIIPVIVPKKNFSVYSQEYASDEYYSVKHHYYVFRDI